ncbi:beta-N-acetylhexosaminidase [Desemzia sp. FAM 24101]|uniref:beta-N-acetylhexosaminidase n=1 Tax=unclassified Desemzia TaxID=2685243 RepID=UPI003889354F
MLKLHLIGDLQDLEAGLKLLSHEYKFEESEAGIPLEIQKSLVKDKLFISYDGQKGIIEYTSKNSFFRLLNLWLYQYKKNTIFSVQEKDCFDKTGVMVDASRNAVVSVSGMKLVLNYMAKLGLNLVMLYTEDTYEVKEYPYFGYLRGRYTHEEMKEMDDYAFELGIEMVPCIQTLGHLFNALKYEYANGIKDTSDVVLVGETKTYEFLENLIQSATKPFRSNHIHIGMDEAFGLGTGVYRSKNGIRDSFTIMNEHLEKVIAITKKHGLEAMIWSDMYYRFGSKTGDYYDLESDIPEEVINDIPDVDMVLWDYYHEDEKTYDILLGKHKEMKKKVIFAGGVWTWNGIAPNYGKSFETTKAGLASAKKNGIREVFATLWGDDGGETPILSALPGLQLFADLSYRDEVGEAQMREEFQYNTGYSLKKFMLLNDFDETPGVMENNLNTSAASKFLLWQDPLLGLYDQTVAGLGLGEHYQNLSIQLKELVSKENDLTPLFEFYHTLAVVLSVKAELGIRLKTAYDTDNKDALKNEVEQMKALQRSLNELRIAHRNVWMEYNKPFGWEVLDIRYGGTISRMSTAVDRVTDYLNGKLDEISELKENKLPFSNPYYLGEGTLGRGLYKDMVTPSKLSDV